MGWLELGALGGLPSLKGWPWLNSSSKAAQPRAHPNSVLCMCRQGRGGCSVVLFLILSRAEGTFLGAAEPGVWIGKKIRKPGRLSMWKIVKHRRNPQTEGGMFHVKPRAAAAVYLPVVRQVRSIQFQPGTNRDPSPQSWAQLAGPWLSCRSHSLALPCVIHHARSWSSTPHAGLHPTVSTL